MSWDIILMKNKIDLADKKAQPEHLGNRDEIVVELLALQNDIDFTDKSWGIYFDGQVSIELSTGSEKEIHVIMLHIRGGGNPFAFIKKVCKHFDWVALDGSTGEYVNLENPSRESWERWQNYSDKIKRS